METLTWWQVRELGQRWRGFVWVFFSVCWVEIMCVCVGTHVLQHARGGQRTPQVLLLDSGQSLLLLIAVFTDLAGPGVSTDFLVSALSSH